MSEKKTSEIKLRIEPSVKAQWQHLAAEEEIGLSEWLTKAAEERGRNQRIAELAELGIPVASDETYKQWYPPGTSATSHIQVVKPPYSLEAKPELKVVPTSEKFGADWKPWDDAA